MEKIMIGKCCKVGYLPEAHCVEIEWSDMPPSEDFRKGCNTVLELLQKHKTSKVLVDNTHVKLFKVADQQWLNQEWLPRAEKAGYRISATVIGDTDAFVKFAAKNIAEKRDHSKFVSQFFKTKNEAINWLKSI